MVADDDIAARAATRDVDTFVAVVIDDISVESACTADRCVSRKYIDAVITVTASRCAATIAAYPVSRDRDAIGASIELHAMPGIIEQPNPTLLQGFPQRANSPVYFFSVGILQKGDLETASAQSRRHVLRIVDRVLQPGNLFVGRVADYQRHPLLACRRIPLLHPHGTLLGQYEPGAQGKHQGHFRPTADCRTLGQSDGRSTQMPTGSA